METSLQYLNMTERALRGKGDNFTKALGQVLEIKKKFEAYKAVHSD
jgi:hypothetical protein